MRNRRVAILALALVAMVLGAGCSGQPLSTREKGTLGGAGIGAAGGAIIGAAVGAPGAGAAIGGALLAMQSATRCRIRKPPTSRPSNRFNRNSSKSSNSVGRSSNYKISRRRNNTAFFCGRQLYG
jgi:hypothetical protein